MALDNDLQSPAAATATFSHEPAAGRWWLLAIVSAAQAGNAVLNQGLAALGPALRDRYDLSLGQTGVLLQLAPLGIGATLFAWGWLADRRSERIVVAVGLIAGGALTMAAPLGTSVWAFAALLFAAGAFAASANAGGGRAVMGWFGPRERATALGLRQMATPVGAAAAVAVTPALLAAGGLDLVMLALGGFIVVTGVVAALGLRPAPAGATEPAPRGHQPTPLRDRRLGRLALGGGLLSAVQISWVTYATLYLTVRHDLPLGLAAALLAVMQVGGALGRVVAGRFSDRSLRRVEPQRRIALAVAVGAVASALTVTAPAAVATVVVVLTGIAAICWNGLGVTAAGELAGTHQAGAAIGLYISVLIVSSTLGTVLFGLCLELSWTAAFAASTLPPLLAWRLLAPLDERGS